MKKLFILLTVFLMATAVNAQLVSFISKSRWKDIPAFDNYNHKQIVSFVHPPDSTGSVNDKITMANYIIYNPTTKDLVVMVTNRPVTNKKGYYICGHNKDFVLFQTETEKQLIAKAKELKLTSKNETYKIKLK